MESVGAFCVSVFCVPSYLHGILYTASDKLAKLKSFTRSAGIT